MTTDISTTTALPILLTVARAVALSGLSRTEIYARLRDGRIAAKKLRRSTLIETGSLLANLAELPSY